MTTISPGFIQPPPVKPLSEEQRKRLRAAAGGDATPDQLERLAKKFAKPERKAEKAEKAEQKSNGWARG